MNKYKH